MAWIIAYALAKKVQRTAITIPLTTNLDFGTYRGINVGTPVNPNDISRKTDLDTHAADPSAHHVKPLGLNKVAEIDVAADTTSMTITGLDINTDKFYLLLFKTKNPTASGSGYCLFVEGDLVTTNYYNQNVYGDGASVGGTRENIPRIIYLPAGERGSCTVWLFRDPDGYPRYFSTIARATGATMILVIRDGSKTATVTNITRIDVQSEVTNAIGAGSKLIIYGASG